MEDEDRTTRKREFSYKFVSNGKKYELKLPIKLPYEGCCRELSVRLIKAHRIPFHLEDELHDELCAFTKTATLEMLDEQTESHMYGGSVFEKGSDTDKAINSWTEQFAENSAQFSSPSERTSSNDATFSEVYHKLIHSPALETLLQLEHTYAMAVAEVIKAWENAQEIITKRQEIEMSKAMSELGRTKTDYDISMLSRNHLLEREGCQEKWMQELTHLRQTQKAEYRDWVTKGYEQMNDSSVSGAGSSLLMPPNYRSSELSASPASSDGLLHSLKERPVLQESFTINLGSQKKTTHNVRILRSDPLSLCEHRRKGDGVFEGPSPERLQTAMSLYSSKLSALVVMVNGRVNSHSSGLKQAFKRVCQQSTDFHFPDIDVQLGKIQECALIRNVERSEADMNMSLCSTSSEEVISPPDSALDCSAASAGVNSPSRGLRTESSMGTAGTGVWSTDRQRSMEASPGRTSPLNDGRTINLEQGDFYVTRHSNLSQVHLVYHLVYTNDQDIMSSGLKSRHPILVGLKNCLRSATMQEVHHITIPLLLTDTMQPEMTISWCLKRAELVFKCVKGFMLETTAWVESHSRTVQFLVPDNLSDDSQIFEEFCDMLPKIFRTTSTRILSSRNRAFSYK